MFDPKNFTTTAAKPLPVYLILDVSTTMGEVVDTRNVRRTGKTFFKDGKNWEIVEGGTSKMDELNEAVQKMLDSFKDEEKMEVEILVSIITFGDNATLHLAPTKASNIKWENIKADGETALGSALKMAKNMIEDKEITPSRAYRPTIILISDGQPNDSWEQPLENFITQGRSSKCDRMAMAIGHDADENVLKRFIEGTPHKLFCADNANKLHEFFSRVTMSVTMRTRSKNPNEILPNFGINNFDENDLKSSDDEGYL
ncbi:MAG: hypothetical protein ACI86H_001910 [bacterium]|jgi:uncharacterized protein YegL